MKIIVDIPDGVMEQAMKFTGAKTKREAIATAVERFNHLKRLEKLNTRARGSFRDFMTQAELKKMRSGHFTR